MLLSTQNGFCPAQPRLQAGPDPCAGLVGGDFNDLPSLCNLEVLCFDFVEVCSPTWRPYAQTYVKSGATQVKAIGQDNCRKACTKDINCIGVNYLPAVDKFFLPGTGCLVVRSPSDGKKTEYKLSIYFELTRNCLRG